MARNWTISQQNAINEHSRTLLVSAAAGSGKTAVLTERIIRSLCDTDRPTDISRLLIVTFTRAAAAEMRARIAKALSEAMALHPDNKSLPRQLMLLGSAKICTIDSFYLELVRANFEGAGLSPSFRMADEGELLTLRRDTMNEAIDTLFATDPNFILVADLLSDVRTEASLGEQLLKLAASLDKLPQRYELLLRAARDNEVLFEAPFDTPHGQLIYGELWGLTGEILRLLTVFYEITATHPEQAALEKKYGACFGEMQARAAELALALEQKNADAVAMVLELGLNSRITSAKRPACEEDLIAVIDALSALREEYKARAKALSGFTTAEIREAGQESATILRLLFEVLCLFDKKYTAAKRERDVAEFGDVSRAAYRLLVDEGGAPTPLALSLREAYDAIYIDEYQDVDAMQDATFRAISTPKNRFMVGDVKQSIYRFRGAEPAVFTGYRRAFPDFDAATENDDAATVFMSDCFRCDENIIRFSNAVSGYLFRERAESIGYRTTDDLCFSKPLPHEGYLSPKCQVLIYDDEAEREAEKKKRGEGEGPEGEDSAQSNTISDCEAEIIAREIARLLSGEKKADGTPIVPGDIAVLSRSAAFAAPLAARLKALRIPVNDTSRESFFENPEVLCMYALLATVDNPFRDVYLAAVLRSPLFGFTLEELVAIRGAADTSFSLYEALGAARDTLKNDALTARIGGFLDKLACYREKAELLPVDKLLRYLYADTAVLALAEGEQEQGHAYLTRKQNLRRLYEYARSFEAGGFKGLYRFVRYVEDIMQNGTEMPTPEGPQNAVSLITIHHSKGLEYPVCFVATTGKSFNRDDLKGQVLIDSLLGCGTRVPNKGAFSRANTFAREAVKIRLRRLAEEEEMRVLYVAMTRARERLYITAKPRYGMKSVREHLALATSPVSNYFSLCGTSFIEWILTALDKTPSEEFCKITYVHPEALETPINAITVEENEKATPAVADASVARVLRERFDFSYHRDHLSRLPAKLSVSRLAPTVLDVYDEGEATDKDLNAPDTETLLHTFDRAPVFTDTPTANLAPDAAARGTATHEFLQFCDFARAEAGLDSELARLVQGAWLSPEAALAVRRDELTRFFKSAFYKSLQNAKELHRETRFNVFLPAADFTQNEALKQELADEKLLVQGVIDLFFIDSDGRLVLCDYKTDRLPPEALHDKSLARRLLFARHGTQLSYYQKALAAMFGKAPDKTVIYSLPLGEALEA